jgi:putative protease
VYLGLRKFSARAKAVNFTAEELSEVVAWAHQLSPRRRVFATVNTLVFQHELEGVIDALATLVELEVDAVIVQDLGVARMAQTYFPSLELHASTQLAVHNLAGAEALAALGFTRVTLARELTLEEISAISAKVPIQTEVFIHGALCYSYSGLCLFSSFLRHRSGNRGECTYPCRELFASSGCGCGCEERALPFSMKDLALPERVDALRVAGVACMKIEGRMKNALYAAVATNFYRKVLDGAGDAAEREALAADVRTVFSRPWTGLYLDSRRARDVTDHETVGHRGDPIGRVEGQRSIGGEGAWLCFTTSAALERHDGIQVDIAGQEKPFGFPVKALRVLHSHGGMWRNAFEAAPGARVAVVLPDDAPRMPVGAPVYQASSQLTKRSYPFTRPKPGEFKVRQSVDVTVKVGPARIEGSASTTLLVGGAVEACASAAGEFSPAREPEKVESAARGAFEKLGATRFNLGAFAWDNAARLFAPVSALNQLRRDVFVALDTCSGAARAARIESIAQEVCRVAALPARTAPPRWVLKIDRLAHVAAFEPADWDAAAELVIDIGTEPLDAIESWLDDVGATLGYDRVRLALPVITREWEESDLRAKVKALRGAGRDRWETANISGWKFLGVDPVGATAIDLSADWPLYAVNRLAAAQILAMGARGFTLSPDDGFDNMRSLLAEFGEQATVIVYQDTPLFISEACAHASLRGACVGESHCDFKGMALVSASGEEVRVVNRNCRSVTIGAHPLCLAHLVGELASWGATTVRADFVWRTYAPEEVRDLWRALREGKRITGTHMGNAK